MSLHRCATVFVVLAVAVAASAQERVLTFEDLTSGATDRASGVGLTVLAGAADQRLTIVDSLADPALRGPAADGGEPWAGGNLDPRLSMGQVLVPPPGGVELRLEGPAAGICLDVLNLRPELAREASVTFFDGRTQVARLTIAELVEPASERFDPWIRLGERTVNRIDGINSDLLEARWFDRVIIAMPDGAAIDNVRVMLLEPTGGAGLPVEPINVSQSGSTGSSDQMPLPDPVIRALASGGSISAPSTEGNTFGGYTHSYDPPLEERDGGENSRVTPVPEPGSLALLAAAGLVLLRRR